jgi:hypothetical protein
MRFIIREQEYEKLEAAGKFRYEMQGKSTGVTESWRLTRLSKGYHLLRVDFDARNTPEDSSTLYHLAVGSGWLPERLKFRHFAGSAEINGDLQFDHEVVSLYRNIGDRRLEDEEIIPGDYRFWLPSVIGFGLLIGTPDINRSRTLTLDRKRDFDLVERHVDIEKKEREVLTITGKDVPVHGYSIAWNSESTHFWLDDHGLPVMAEKSGGYRAIESQYIRYFVHPAQ